MNARNSPVAAAWHDTGFGQVISPARTLYAQASCGTCGRFDSCHEDGRCLFEASMRHGGYYTPDRACGGPSGPIPLRLITHAANA